MPAIVTRVVEPGGGLVRGTIDLRELGLMADKTRQRLLYTYGRGVIEGHSWHWPQECDAEL